MIIHSSEDKLYSVSRSCIPVDYPRHTYVVLDYSV